MLFRTQEECAPVYEGKGSLVYNAGKLFAGSTKKLGDLTGPTHAHRQHRCVLRGCRVECVPALIVNAAAKRGPVVRRVPHLRLSRQQLRFTCEQMALQEARKPATGLAILHQNSCDSCEGLRTYTDASSLPVPEAVNTQLQAHHSSSTTTNSTMTCSARRQSQWQSLTVLT